MNARDKELLIVFLFSIVYLIFLLIMLVQPNPKLFFPAYLLLGLLMFLFFYFELKNLVKLKDKEDEEG